MKDLFINKHSIEVALAEKGGIGSIKVNPIVTYGTKIAEITVDDKKSEIFAPEQKESTNVQVNPIVTQGTKIADIVVDGNKNEIYSPNYDDTEIKNQIENKVSKESGKGLSTNDYSTQDKNKVDALGTISQKNIWIGTDSQYQEIKNKEQNTLYFIII